MEERNSIAYNVAALNLATIGKHPKKVEEAFPGYFLEAANIFGYTDFDPKQWYLRSDATFFEIDPVDRIEIDRILSKFTVDAISESEIKQLCKECLELAEVLSSKTVLDMVGGFAD
jgi:hypothetical protein